MSKNEGIQRRTILKGGLAIAGTLATTTVINASQTCASYQEADQWSGLLGERFSVKELSASGDLSLVHSLKLGDVTTDDRSNELHRPQHVRRNTISLMFQSETQLESSNVKMFHPALGHRELMISETRHESCRGKYVYQAVLN